jgi:hypothetical protein
LSTAKIDSYRTKLGRRILTLELAPTTTAFHAHARLVLMAYLYLPHEFENPKLFHSVRKIAAYTGLHSETVKRTRKRLVDLAILVKVGKRPGKNGLMKDVLTWGSVLLEPPPVARPNEHPSVASRNEQLAVARSVARLLPVESAHVTPGSVGNGILAAARSNERPTVARSDGQPPAARRNRRRPAARRGERETAEAVSVTLTPEEQNGLGTLHRFVRTVAGKWDAAARILGALQPILDANDPEVVWDLVLRRNPYVAEDLELLRQAESLWREQGSTQQFVDRMAPVVV